MRLSLSFIAAGDDFCFIVVIVDADGPEPKECLETPKGYDYKGHKRRTVSGKTCQAWASQAVSTVIKESPALYNTNMCFLFCYFATNGTKHLHFVWQIFIHVHFGQLVLIIFYYYLFFPSHKTLKGKSRIHSQKYKYNLYAT